VPGPAIGFLQEAVRWWDHWLKGEDNGIEDEPMLRAWMQDGVPPSAAYQDRPGRWVGEPSWPTPNTQEQAWTLTRWGLVDGDVDERHALSIQSPLSVGMFAGKWASYAAAPDLPYDQREEDGGALVFETPPLEEPLELLGLPYADLEVHADKPVAQLAVRLSDVAPNGEATRVTYGLLNLTHRDGSADPQPLEPGHHYRVRVQLNGIAQSFPADHRLRLSVSTSYWPLVWPSPERATVTVHTGTSRLSLPVRRPRPEDDGALRPFDEPETTPELEVTPLQVSEHHWRTTRDLVTDVSTLEIVNDQGAFRIDETGTLVRRATNEWYSFRWNEVNSVRGETRTVRRLERDDWRVEVRTRTVLTSTPDDFVVTAQLDAYELDAERGDPRVFSESWERAIPRDLV